MLMTDEKSDPKEIAFVAYPGLTPLDLVGPLQVVTVLTLFSPAYRPVVVGETLDPIHTDGPMKLVPDKTFSQVSSPFALIVPGGAAPTMRALSNDSLIAYVQRASESAEVVGSVCTGSLILAAAGLLEGRNATTHWSFSKQLERLGAHYLPERWVEDGKVISAAGVTAGIDMALHVVGRLAGETVARQVQLVLEYDPQPPLGGIDWSQIDRDMLDPVVDQWINEGLADQPDLLSRLLPESVSS
jgi:transcriptional regulator GlxA family with amidase domain